MEWLIKSDRSCSRAWTLLTTWKHVKNKGQVKGETFTLTNVPLTVLFHLEPTKQAHAGTMK